MYRIYLNSNSMLDIRHTEARLGAAPSGHRYYHEGAKPKEFASQIDAVVFLNATFRPNSIKEEWVTPNNPDFLLAAAEHGGD